MRSSRASQTAMGTASVRAIESEKPADLRICYDPLARRLVNPWFYWAIRLLAGYGERRTRGALTFIVCRCRYIDDYLQVCLQRGICQVVILGAGLDSRAYRSPLSSEKARTFEIDHPATQRDKIERVKKVLAQVPENVTWVPLDFNRETLDKLREVGFDPLERTLFIWEGVTPYLLEEAVDATLTWIGVHAAPGSTVIFDYQDSPEPTRHNHIYAVLTRITGEVRSFGIPRGQIEAFLSRRGFARVENVTADQLAKLYCTGPNLRRTVAQKYSIVHAEIPATDAEPENAKGCGA